MKRIPGYFIALVLLSAPLAKAKPGNNHFNWNGYTQIRFYKKNNDSQGFIIRRAKLWVKGNVGSLNELSYKVMGIFKYNKTGYFGLLDVYATYNFGFGYVRLGQQIPEFSLQRLQPDWKIPVIERAESVNKLIPAAQTSARDIGIQTHLAFSNKRINVAAGVFNGNGANLKNHNSADFLYNLRSFFVFNITDKTYLHLGASAMYRKVKNADFSTILGKGTIYTGKDFRYGIETLLKLDKVQIQAEYLKAIFGDYKVDGYYALISFNATPKDQFVISTEILNDLNTNMQDYQWLKVGYNRLFESHKLKLMVHGGTQFHNEFYFITQLQYFFN